MPKQQEPDYSQRYIQTGQRPQNYIKNNEPNQRYIDQSKTRQLITLKSQVINRRNHPAILLKQDLKTYDLKKLGKFDVILMDPPWEQYQKRVRGSTLYQNERKNERNKYKSWSLQQMLKLQIDAISDSPSFLFLWVGSQHLDDGRQLLKKWQFKRCQDICWVKTNFKRSQDQIAFAKQKSWFKRVKEHCLVGLKGDSKKASDTLFIHPNIDTDVIIQQEPQFGSFRKPLEIYDIIQRFCLGRKRIQLFGESHNLRKGWLTVGLGLRETTYNAQEYNSWFHGQQAYPLLKDYKGGRRLGTTPQIQNLRPKSPVKQVINTQPPKTPTYV